MHGWLTAQKMAPTAPRLSAACSYICITYLRAMNLIENIREGMRAIQANLLRTVLTALIVAIGITALVGILTAVDSIKYSLNNTMASLGASSFEIEAKGYSNRYSHGGRQGKVYPPITYAQARRYKELVSDNAQVSISAFVAGAVTVKAGNIKSNPNISVHGIDENFLAIKNYNIEQGRPFSGSELMHGSQVVLIGKELAEMLFPKQNPVGKSISFLAKHYRVGGRLAKTGSGLGGGGAGARLGGRARLPRARPLPRRRREHDPLADPVRTFRQPLRLPGMDHRQPPNAQRAYARRTDPPGAAR